MRLVSTAAVWLLMTVVAVAQIWTPPSGSAPITAYYIRIIDPAGQLVVQANGLPVEFQMPFDEVFDDQDPPQPPIGGVLVNPSQIFWDDPARPAQPGIPGRKMYGPFLPWEEQYRTLLPNGSGYRYQLIAESATGRSPASAPSGPFTINRPDPPPAAPTGVVAA